MDGSFLVCFGTISVHQSVVAMEHENYLCYINAIPENSPDAGDIQPRSTTFPFFILRPPPTNISPPELGDFRAVLVSNNFIPNSHIEQCLASQ